MNKSETLFQRANEVIPGGVNNPLRAFRAVKKTPFFVKKAQGAYLFDEDDIKYIDYVAGATEFSQITFYNSSIERGILW